MEESLGVRPAPPMAPIRCRRARGWRGSPRHVLHAGVWPRRIPPRNRGRLRRRPHPRRDRVLFHPNARGRCEAPRPSHGPRRLPRPPGNLRDPVPASATMAQEPLARHGLLHIELRGNRPARHPPDPRCRLPWVEHVGGVGFAVFSQVIGYWLYAALLDHVLVDVAAEHPEGFSLSRRQFIIGTIGAVAVAALTVYGLGSLISKKGRLVFTSVAEMFSKEQTPTSEFYVVTKNVIDPTVDASRWALSIEGLVSSPTTYSYADLQTLATVDEFVTLECVSNEVGGNLISTAEWTGVRLATILQSAGADPSVDNWIVF